VDPGKPTGPTPAPADAVVLFAGQDLSKWKPAAGWKVVDGTIEAGKGQLSSTEEFGNMQVHVEFMGPPNFQGPWYNQGNNGVLLMGLFEIQIFDSWNEKLYPDGQCAAIYGQTPPLVNVTRAPGEWQSFDIVFQAPRFEGEKLLEPARVTVFHNGVLVHHNEPIHGTTGHRIVPKYNPQVTKGPLALSGHDCPVRFRNIWVRKL
jgi:hypothetical protein